MPQKVIDRHFNLYQLNSSKVSMEPVVKFTYTIWEAITSDFYPSSQESTLYQQY